jgi:hypothetical protein
MWLRQSHPNRRPPSSIAQISDLGSQLEDLVMHVLRCEKWARFDDRIDLSLAVERARPLRRQPRR